MKSFLLSAWPILLFLFLTAVFFYPVWYKGLVPMPADLIVGSYYPWHDYKWAGFDAGVPVKNPLISDVPSVIYPQRLLAIEQIKQGYFPLWNNLMFSGYPLLATFQSAALYPLNIFLIVLPFIDGWSLLVILQPMLAGIFTYLLLRHLKLSKTAALFGAIAYSFSGFNIFFLEFNVHGHVAALIPLMLLLADKYIVLKNINYLISLSFIVLIQILAGYPQLSLYSYLLILSWAFFKLKIWLFPKDGFLVFLKISAFLFLGIGLSGIQLFPGIELFSLSQRVTENLDYSIKFLPTEQLIFFFAPDYFGNSGSYNFWGTGNFANVAGYTGLVSVILSLLSLNNFQKIWEIRFFLLLSALCLAVVVDTPVIRWIFDHLLNNAQALSMTRMMVLVNLSLAVLGSYGLDYLMTKADLREIVRSLYLPFVVLAGVFIGTLGAFFYLQNNINLDPNLNLEEPIKNYSVALRNLILPQALLIASAAIMFFSVKINKSKKYTGLLLIFLLAFELFRFGWKLTPFSKKEFVFPQTPATNYLKNQKQPYRVSLGDVIPANMWMPYQIESADGYDAVYPQVQSRLLGAINSLEPNTTGLTRYGTIYDFSSNLFDLTNSKYVLALKKDAGGNISPEGQLYGQFKLDKFKKSFEDKSVVILENTKVLPRAFVVTKWQVAKNDQAALAAILDGDFPLKEKVVLSETFDKYPQFLDNQSKVEYESLGYGQNNLKVETEKPGLLFIADTFYPGWKAFVDGRQMPILRADYAFKAVPVEAGSHNVRLYYQPISFEIGKYISLLSLLIIGVILIFKTLRAHA